MFRHHPLYLVLATIVAILLEIALLQRFRTRTRATSNARVHDSKQKGSGVDNNPEP